MQEALRAASVHATLPSLEQESAEEAEAEADKEQAEQVDPKAPTGTDCQYQTPSDVLGFLKALKGSGWVLIG